MPANSLKAAGVNPGSPLSRQTGVFYNLHLGNSTLWVITNRTVLFRGNDARVAVGLTGMVSREFLYASSILISMLADVQELFAILLANSLPY